MAKTHLHLDPVSLTEYINSKVADAVAGGKSAVGTGVAKQTHLNGVDVASQIAVATGQPSRPMHMDPVSIQQRLTDAIAAMPEA